MPNYLPPYVQSNTPAQTCATSMVRLNPKLTQLTTKLSLFLASKGSLIS